VVSERRVCRVLEQCRTSQRYAVTRRPDESALVLLVISLACQYGGYGYRIVTGLIRLTGWRVTHKRVERIWREAGLKVPQKQPKRRRLWSNDGSCIRLRPEYPNHVWSYDFVSWQTAKGRPLKILSVFDEYTRECLALLAARRIISAVTTVRSSPPRWCEDGWRGSRCRPCSSHQAVRGRTAMSRVLTVG
jgi:putative transposase